MAESRILTPADRQAIREHWDAGGNTDEFVVALLDTCDAMTKVIRRLLDGWYGTPGFWSKYNIHTGDGGQADEPMTPAEAAVLDAIRESS